MPLRRPKPETGRSRRDGYIRASPGRNRRDNPPWLSFARTGAEACPYGEQFDDRGSLPEGIVAKVVPDRNWPPPSFRRKPESILCFLLIFAFDSDSRKGTPRPKPERVKRIYMAASVFSRSGERTAKRKTKDKGENGFRAIPSSSVGIDCRNDEQKRRSIPSEARLFQQAPQGGRDSCSLIGCPKPSS